MQRTVFKFSMKSNKTQQCWLLTQLWYEQWDETMSFSSFTQDRCSQFGTRAHRQHVRVNPRSNSRSKTSGDSHASGPRSLRRRLLSMSPLERSLLAPTTSMWVTVSSIASFQLQRLKLSSCSSVSQTNRRQTRAMSTRIGREDARSRAGPRAQCWWNTRAQAPRSLRARGFSRGSSRDLCAPHSSHMRKGHSLQRRQQKKSCPPTGRRPRRHARAPRCPRGSCICVIGATV